MVGRTNRYGITYAENNDRVSDIATHQKNLAQTVENALATVDDRHTDATGKPIVRDTLTQLNAASPFVGQAGWVKNDITSNNGLYIWNGYQWKHYVEDQPVKQTTARLPYQSGGTYTLMRKGNIVTLTGQGTCTSTGTQANARVNETIPAGYRPKTATAVGWGNNQKMDMLIYPDGHITLLGSANGWVNLGATWICDEDYSA